MTKTKLNVSLGLMLLIIPVALLLAFLIISGLTWVVCWSFSIPFMWKYSFGVWALLILLKIIFGRK